MAISRKLVILKVMKKILIRPRYLIVALLLLVAVVAGIIYTTNRETGPQLSAEEKAQQKRVEPLETCLQKANNSEAQQSVIQEAREKCLNKYPDL